ncbi:OLC1v1015739C1 [Oldenlandia corymbosa var. corymbosa]|uniref:OLC1v1015739C1 n=1 Tax=Oldenlandia corymbosa var. corymbosa TaxID=529605 RepID=A0AAV1E662_OLDCO|nr:OLC1v1015739C1 [Oldenlandia corymbosa var. corymbosa]
MMNVVALCLVFTTLATAGVWSPSPERVQIKQDVIVKEGHRTVEIEYGQDNGNTKVKISPQEGYVDSSSSSSSPVSSTVKEKLSEGAEKVSEGVEHVKDKIEEEIGHRATPRELICDAYGKCKHRVASALGKTKEVLSEKAHQAKDTVEEKAHEVKDKVEEKAYEVKDRVEEVEGGAKHAVGETVGKVKEAVSKTAREVADKAHDVKEKVRGASKEASDIGKTLRNDVKKNATREIERTKKKVEEAGENIEHKKEGLKGILKRGVKSVGGIFGYVFSPELRNSGVGIMQLLGLSTAYGMSVWVTFISSYINAGALPKQQFAVLQSKIYPAYFRSMAYSVGMVLLAHWLSPRKGLHPGKSDVFQGFNLLASLVMLLFNLNYVEPRATKAMFERMRLEKEEGRGMETKQPEPSMRNVDSVIEPSGRRTSAMTGAVMTTTNLGEKTSEEANDAAAAHAKSEMVRLSEALKKLNSYSSFLNVLTLMALTWHLVYLGQMLHSTVECA